MKVKTVGAEGEVLFKFRVLDPFSNPATVMFWAKDKDAAFAMANDCYGWYSTVEFLEVEGNVTFERV